MPTGRSRQILIAILLVIFSLLAFLTLLPTFGYRPSLRHLAQGQLLAARNMRTILQTDAFASTIAYENGFAYVVGGKAPLQDESQARGLTIWSLADPAAPALVGFLDGFFGYDVAVKDGFVYIASGGELVVVDARDAVRPALIDVLPAEGLFELHQVGRELYLLNATGVSLYATDDPTNLRLVQSIPDLLAFDVAGLNSTRVFLTADALVYYTPGDNGLAERGSIPLEQAPENSDLINVDNELAVAGNFVVATGLGGWHLFDFGGVEPIYEGFYAEDVGRPAGAALAYPHLYLADWENGVLVVDLTDASQPAVVGYDRDLAATDLIVLDDVIYTSSRALQPVTILRHLR